MQMEIFRAAFMEDSDYIYSNVYFYHELDGWNTNQVTESLVKPSVQFIGEILDGVKKSLTTTVMRSRMIRLMNKYFPGMMEYIQAESLNQRNENAGENTVEVQIRENTPISLRFFEVSIEFYKVTLMNY